VKGGIKLTESYENKCVTEVYGLIHVKIPQEISNNVYTNIFLLHPFPEYYGYSIQESKWGMETYRNVPN